MLEERFSEGSSLLHGLDPRVKLVVAGLFALVVAVGTRLDAAAFALGLALLWTLLARLPFGPLARRFLALNLFVGFLWLFLPFATPGETAFHLGPLTATRQGLDHALLITLKANAIMLALTALVATTPVPRLGVALQALRLPPKLVFLLAFTYRYLFVIAEEYRRLSDAAKARNFVPRTNLHTYSTYANFMGMLLVNSVERSERVHEAMLCRGFTGRFVSVTPLRATGADAAFALSSAAALAGLLLTFF